MSNEKKDKIEIDNQRPNKGNKHEKQSIERETTIPETLKEVQNFLMAEIDKQDSKQTSKQNILFLTEDQLISSGKKSFADLTSEEMVVLKKLIRDVVSEELDNRGLLAK